MQNYTLKCLKSDEKFEDEYTLHYNDGALVQAVYREKFQPIEKEGVWRYANWLPTKKTSYQTAGTVTYKAEKLGHALGFSNLWIAFHGYWPEKEVCVLQARSKIWKQFLPYRG